MIFDNNGRMLKNFARPEGHRFGNYEYCYEGSSSPGYFYKTIINHKILIIENYKLTCKILLCYNITLLVN